MTLGFKREINGKPTFFAEKIASYLVKKHPRYMESDEFEEFIKSKYYDDLQYVLCLTDKLHTIRRDAGNRWKAGMKIHAVINNRTKDRLQFLPEFECKEVQHIKIYPYEKNIWVAYKNNMFMRLLSNKETNTLAINDGFLSVADFWDYFKEPFEGKIIHWTNKRY